MKKLALLLIILTTTFASAQITRVKTKKDSRIEIGKVTPKGVLSIKMEKINDTHYLVSFKDMEFPQSVNLREFRINSEEDFNGLYDIIIEGFDELPEEPMMLDIGNGYLYLNYGKLFGVEVVRFSHADTHNATSVSGYSDQLNKKQIQRLFNKE